MGGAGGRPAALPGRPARPGAALLPWTVSLPARQLLQPRGQQRRHWGAPTLLVAYVGYVGLGAGALQALERPAEVQAARHLLQQHWELLANHTCLQGPGLQRLIEVSLSAPSPARQRRSKAPPAGSCRGRRCLRPGAGGGGGY